VICPDVAAAMVSRQRKVFSRKRGTV